MLAVATSVRYAWRKARRGALACQAREVCRKARNVRSRKRVAERKCESIPESVSSFTLLMKLTTTASRSCP